MFSVLNCRLMQKSWISIEKTKSCALLLGDVNLPVRYFRPSPCLLAIAKRNENEDNRQKKISTEIRSGPKELSIGGKVAEAGKTASYAGVILLGVGVTGFIFYVIGRELFSSESPSGVYSKALDLCVNDYKVITELGEPIKGFGEMTRRGRARYVSHMEYERDGVPHMRVNFHLKGSLRKGIAQAEVKKADSGKYDFRYIIVQTEDYPMTTVVVVDNR